MTQVILDIDRIMITRGSAMRTFPQTTYESGLPQSSDTQYHFCSDHAFKRSQLFLLSHTYKHASLRIDADVYSGRSSPVHPSLSDTFHGTLFPPTHHLRECIMYRYMQTQRFENLDRPPITDFLDRTQH